MGQCNSSLPAVECCNDPSRHKQAAAADETRPSVTSSGTTNQSSLSSVSGQNVVVESTSGSTSSNNAIQFSVALDQESEHSVCIRVELPDGKSLLLTTSLHESSHHTMRTTNRSRVETNQTVGVGSSKEPNKKHYKDIHFHAKPTPRDLATPPYVYFPPNYRRDTPRKPQQWSHRPYVVSQGIESPPSAFRRHQNVEQNTPCPQRSDGALQSGKIHTSMVSTDGLVEKQSDLMKKNSCHSQETENSWGDISVQKCIKCMPPPMTGKHDGKATFPPLDISMNDISGNTLPTRVDYDDGKDDEVSVTDDDEELDHQWEYHRNVRSLTVDNCMVVGPPSGQTRSESSSSPVPRVVFSPTASFTSNLSSLPRAKSYMCRHRHSNLFFSDTDVKNHSSRTCQSDSCMVMEHRLKSKTHSSTTRQPWNPQSFPAF